MIRDDSGALSKLGDGVDEKKTGDFIKFSL